VPTASIVPVDSAAPRHALVVLPSSSGALSVEEQPKIAVPPTATTQDALLAIHAELIAAGGDAHDARGRRRWPAFASAAAVVALLAGLTASGAASTFGARANDGLPTWQVWNPPAPLVAAVDSAAPVPAERTLYEVRLAAAAPPQPAVRATHPLIPAHLIGPVPKLALPAILADRRTDGEVVVRFAVDARGVPDTASLAVVRTPHEVLTEVVRRALPAMRFEPARRAIAGAAAEPDAVEMSFRFSRSTP
jgi:TonB family protein